MLWKNSKCEKEVKKIREKKVKFESNGSQSFDFSTTFSLVKREEVTYS
jgi:hypothetical protein